MNSTLPKFAAPLICILASILLLAACGGGESKEDILAQTWDCLLENDPETFELSMLAMMPTANDIDEAKEQFIYVSSVAPIEDLKASRDRACGASASAPAATPQPAPATAPAATPRDTEEPRPTATPETASAATLWPTETETNPRTVAAATSPSFVSVSVGDSHNCGVRSGGSVACWGYNGSERATPPQGSFVSVSAGSDHTCGVMSNASVVCWGEDQYRQATPSEGSFVSVGAGEYRTCGKGIDGSVACWGDDTYAQSTPPEGSFVSVGAGWTTTVGS